jgi:uncharacterized protein (TIGR01777 family)
LRVVILGGTGLIGSALAERLKRDDREVVVVSRHPGRAGRVSGVTTVGWDAESPVGWGHLVAGAAVVNLAGAGLADRRWSARRKAVLLSSRVQAGRAVARAAAAAEPPVVVVQASAVGYYGPCGDEEVSEEHPPGDDFLARLCVEWEASSAAVEAAGVRRVVVRTGVVLSGRGGALPRMLPPFRLGLGGRLGSGRQWLAWIHADDAAAALEHLIDAPEAAGPYNLVAPAPVRNADFTKALAGTLGRPAPWVIPATALRVAFGEVAHTLVTGQRALPRHLEAGGFSFRFGDLGEALADILR